MIHTGNLERVSIEQALVEIFDVCFKRRQPLINVEEDFVRKSARDETLAEFSLAIIVSIEFVRVTRPRCLDYALCVRIISISDRVVFDAPRSGIWNNDGFPDLLVTIYTDLSSPPSKPPFVFPNDFPGASSYLYHNNGDDTFTNVTASTDLRWNRGRARNALFADLNNDGHPDLILFREERTPAVYLNDGTGAFREWTSNAGEQLSRNAFF